YDVAASFFKGNVVSTAEVAEKAEEAVAAYASGTMLFTTKTCPKCRMAKMFLDQAGIRYETLLAEENGELAKAYGIKEAPTLVVIKGDRAELISNPSNIKGYVDKVCVKA
ncbi:MAG: ribonucleoside triphosphate reductase, partial [Clostridia bacterium]|nr:ribonucleoside triphosphate reductase [Clostridia bacterium]